MSLTSASKLGFYSLPLSEMHAIHSRFNERVSAAFREKSRSKDWVRKALRRQGAERCPLRLRRLSLDVILRVIEATWPTSTVSFPTIWQ